ncbi:glycerophosphodiester phosphodiesterase family protein [Paenibacillus sp. PDC88]|uniref:glycerophosphodiester phosphodiesterase family protein n=1 Tax=Paenibacillus TaxID=44249 RepID=UPI00089B7B78|nr:glycerophosphodiester phosphodiesterase family protein [Paenibacillus sp. PDC88]SDX83209.1 Glycerophosphoryl diester phosphodiesterase [Paenibacillus sp. PDC88]
MKRLAKYVYGFLIVTLLCGLLPFHLFQPQAHAEEAGRKSLAVSKTLTPPVIDGNVHESFWKIEQTLDVRVGEGTFKDAKFGLLWDNRYLYIGVRADDDNLISGASGYWFEQDNINFFLDPTKHQSAPFASDDMQIGFVYQPGTTTPEFHFGAALNGHSGKDEKKILRAIQTTGSGWSLEVAIPWDMLHFDPVTTKELGLEVGVTDRYGPDTAQQRTRYWSAYNSSSFWNDTTGYGVISLVDRDPVSGSVNPVLLDEDFDSYPSGTIPFGWITDGSAGSPPFSVVQDTYGNGRMVFDGKGAGKQGRITAPVQWDNYVIEADVRFESVLDPSRWAALMFRGASNGKSPYNQMAIRLNGTYELAYRKLDNGWYSPTPISGTWKPLALNRDYTMKVRVFDNNVKEYMKEASDPDFTLVTDKWMTSNVLLERGKVGLQADQSKISFDNLKVTRITVDRIDTTMPATVEALTGPVSVTHSVYFSDGITESVPSSRFKYYSSDESIIRIVDNQIYPVKPGTAKIKAVFDNAETEQTVTVTPSTTGSQVVSLEHDDGYILAVAGQEINLNDLMFTGKYNDFSTGTIPGDELTWSSTASDVVIEGGKLKKATKKGIFTVTAQKDAGIFHLTVAVKNPEDAEYVLYEENFDQLADGALPPGWERIQGSTPSAAAVKSGAFELDATKSPDNPSRILLPDYLGAFGDYKIEADVTHLAVNESSRWHSIMYRVQNGNYPYYQMAVRQSASSNGVEFAEMTPGNAWNVMEKASYTENIQPDRMYHYTIKTKGNRVQEWIGEQLIIDTDAATAYQKGRIGLQANGSKMKVDNMKVTLQESPLPPMSAERYVRVAAPETKIALAPSVVSEIKSPDDLAAMNEATLPATVMLYVTADLQVTDPSGTAKIGSLESVLGELGTRMIPAFYVKDEQTVDRLIQYLKLQALEDAFLVSDNGELVKRAHAAYPIIRGIVDYSAVGAIAGEDLLDIRRNTSASQARIAILPQKAASSKETVDYLQQRSIMVWARETAGPAEQNIAMHRLITAGVNGIVTDAPSAAFDAFKVYSNQITLIRKPYMIAHRGLPTKAPENTIESNILGLDAGADFIENDMLLSKDGHLVIVHDNTLDRTTNGTGQVEDYTLEQLKALNANKPYPTGFPDVKIPTWIEQIELAKSRGKMIESEIKSAKPEAVEAVVRVIRENDAEDIINIMSFNTEQLVRMRQRMPEMPTGLLVSRVSSDETNPNKSLRDALKQVQGINATFNVGYYGLGRNFLEAAHHRGLLVSPWTINNKNDFISFFLMGPWGITTDYADYASDWAASIQPEKDQYAMKQNSSMSISAIVESYKGEETVVVPEIVVIDGQDALVVSGNKVTAKKKGTAHVLLRYTAAIDESHQYDIYTQPVTITVRDDNSGGNKGGNSGNSGGNSGNPGGNSGNSGENGGHPGTGEDGEESSDRPERQIEAIDGKLAADTLKEVFASDSRVVVKWTGQQLELPAEGLSGADADNGHMLIIQNDDAGYILPLSALRLDALARELNTSVSGLSLRVTMQKVSAGTASAIEHAVNAAGGRQIAEPVHFEIEAVGREGRSVPVSFGATYVARELTLDKEVDVKKATGVLYVPETNEVRFVPTVFETKGGKTTAVLKRNGNSIYTVVENNKSFADLAGHWAREDVELLANKLVLNGVDESRFDGERNVTRAEFASMLVRALGLSPVADRNPFSDVDPAAWYAHDVAAAAAAGLISGYEDGSFRPNQEIRRAEQAVMTVRALAYAGIDAAVSASMQDDILGRFADADKIGWAGADIAAAVHAGLMNGMSQDRLDPDSHATRAQSAVMIKRFLSKAEFIN